MLQESVSLIPDRAEIQRDLEYMTARWGELGQKAKFEVRAFKEHSSPQIGKFNSDWIGDAVDWIDSLNRRGYNIYVVRNPIRYETAGSATDDDIIGSFFLWADCDDPAAAGNVHRFDGPKWAAAVVTGTVPSVRVHTYWMLDEPVTDMAQWRQMQISIARHFASDGSVINPSRIMRVGGTISYPDSRKRQRGYVNELTTIRTEYPDEREPVSMDQMQRVFAAAQPAQPRLSEMATPAPRQGGLQIDTGNSSQTSESEVRELLSYIPPDCGYQDWLSVLMGLHDKFSGSELGLSIADEWSAGGTKYVAGEVSAKWKSFDVGGGSSFGSVAELARHNGADLSSIARRHKPAPSAQSAQFRDLSEAEISAIPPLMFKPWRTKDLSQIPVPEFLYSDFYARKYTSVTLAAPKVGKSMLGLAEALDMATGRGFLTGVPRDPLVVVYYNAEDDQDVMDARIAALLTHYRIPQSEIEGRFYPVSGVETEDFYMMSGDTPTINEPLFVGLEKFCVEAKADVLIFDPLQDLTRSPESNEAFRLLGQRLRRMANKSGVALGLIHHTRKVAPGVTPSIDDMRGGSALRGTARFNRILISMTEDEAAKAGLPNHRHFLRIGDMESNLAPPSSEVNQWFQKVSVRTPNGHSVGAVVRWEWPDAFDGVTRQDAARVRAVFASAAEPPRADIRSAKWAGVLIADTLGIDLTTTSGKAKVKVLLEKWLASDVLRVAEGRDNRAGRPVNIVIAGDNNPMSEVVE